MQLKNDFNIFLSVWVNQIWYLVSLAPSVREFFGKFYFTFKKSSDLYSLVIKCHFTSLHERLVTDIRRSKIQTEAIKQNPKVLEYFKTKMTEIHWF